MFVILCSLVLKFNPKTIVLGFKKNVFCPKHLDFGAEIAGLVSVVSLILEFEEKVVLCLRQ